MVLRKRKMMFMQLQLKLQSNIVRVYVWNIAVEDQGEEIVNLREIVQLLSAFSCEKNLGYIIHAHEVEQGLYIVHCAVVQYRFHQEAIADVFLLGLGRVPKQGGMIGYIFFSRCHAAKIRKTGQIVNKTHKT